MAPRNKGFVAGPTLLLFIGQRKYGMELSLENSRSSRVLKSCRQLVCVDGKRTVYCSWKKGNDDLIKKNCERNQVFNNQVKNKNKYKKAWTIVSKLERGFVFFSFFWAPVNILKRISRFRWYEQAAYAEINRAQVASVTLNPTVYIGPCSRLLRRLVWRYAFTPCSD